MAGSKEWGAVGVADLQVVAAAQQLVDRLGLTDAVSDSLPWINDVILRGVDEDRSGGQGGQDLAVVEGHPPEIVAVVRGDARHVIDGGVIPQVPAGVGSRRIRGPGAEAATDHEGPHPVVERPQPQSVVAAQGVADTADARGVHLRPGRQVVQRPDVVPHPFHHRAGVAGPVGIVGLAQVVAEGPVVRRQGDEAALGQLLGVEQVGIAHESCGFCLAVVERLVQAEHRRQATGLLRQQQVGRQTVVRLALVGHLEPGVGGAIDRFQDLRVQGQVATNGW